MKPINLRSLVNANESLSADVCSCFLQNYGIEFKLGEIEDLIYLLENIARESDKRRGSTEKFLNGYKDNGHIILV